VLGTPPSVAVRGAEETREAFAEVLAPLAVDQPWAERLEAQASLRWTDTSREAAAWTWGLGGLWKPRGHWTLPASAPRALPPPNANELFTVPVALSVTRSGADDFCSAANDPVGRGLTEACVAQGMARSAVGVYAAPRNITLDTFTGGNLDLRPETARTYTVGVT